MLRRYPGRKDENWWLVVGDPAANALLAIKRVKLGAKWKGRLEFAAPEPAVGKAAPALMLYLMCDSYMGADQVTTLYISRPLNLSYSSIPAWWREGVPSLMISYC